MQISAELIRALRSRTGAALVHCKTALADAGGDVEAAVTLIQKRDQAVPENLEDRPLTKTTESRAPKTPEPVEAVPISEEEERICEAIRAKDEALAAHLLQDRSQVSVRVVQAALAHGTGLSHVVGLDVAQLAGAGHLLARAVGSSHADPKLRAALLDKVLEAIPPGMARSDALRVGVGTVGGDKVAPAMPNASTARKGMRCGVAIRDLALLMNHNDRVEEVRECTSHEEALSIVEEWVGARPARLMSFGANAPHVASAFVEKHASGAKAEGWTKRWSARTHFGDYPRPVVHDGVVWCLVHETSIAAHDLVCGDTLWEVPFEGVMHGVAVSPSLVLITYSRGVLALNREDGVERWHRELDCSMTVDCSPLIDDALGFHVSRGGVHAVSLHDGRELWHVACSIHDHCTLLDLGSRLLVPTHVETLIIDKNSGEVIERLPIPGDLAVRLGGERPAVLVACAGRSHFHWLCLDDGSRGSAEVTSVCDEYGTALPIDKLAVSGSRVYATTVDWASRFCFDLDVDTGTVRLVRESPGEQHWAITVDDAHVYTYAGGRGGRVDVLDLMLRPIASFVSGTVGICPRIVPTDRGAFISTDGTCAYFEAPATQAPTGPGERTVTEGLAAPVLAQLKRLSGVHPKSVRQRVMQTPSGPIELSGPLSLYLGVTWMAKGLLYGDPQRPIHLFDGDLVEENLARDHDGPLVRIGEDDLQWSYVIRAHDESNDPVVYSLDHDGSDTLEGQGERLSVFLARITPAGA